MLEILQNQSFLFLLLINMVAAIGMNLVYVTGQLNLGQAGFLAIGAYAAAFTDKVLDWPLVASLAAGAVAAGLAAVPVALGANRTRGIYLIMGTLAVGEVVRISIANVEAVGGLQGFSGITPVSLPEVAVAWILTLAGAAILMSSPLGLKMRSIFDDEDAAAAAGVATRRVKIAAVVFSAAVVGVAGGLMAKWLLFIAPRNFGIEVSFRIALFTLIGGVHSLGGALVGAFSVTYLLEFLKRIGDIEGLPSWMSQISSWRLVIYGGLVMLLMAVRREGIISRHWSLSITGLFRQISPEQKQQKTRIPAQGTAGDYSRATGKPLLQLDQISHHFGGIQALDDVTLAVHPVEILALIGANGAGKTTLTNVVGGRLSLQRGSIRLENQELGGMRPERRVGAGIARTFQSVRMFGHLTVREHLRLGHLACGGRQSLPEREILRAIGLSGKPDSLPGSLSLGEQRRLEIGRAVASSPLVVILDEPSAGMNENEREELATLIRQIRAWGTAIVLIDHNVDLAFGLADRVAVMDFGRLLSVGLPEDVLQDPKVRQAYLGTAEA